MTAPAPTELLPCPFCGGKGELHYFASGECIKCDDCGVETALVYDGTSAVVWNTRQAASVDRAAQASREIDEILNQLEDHSPNWVAKIRAYIRGNASPVPSASSPAQASLEPTDAQITAALEWSLSWMMQHGVDGLSPFIDYPPIKETIAGMYRAMTSAVPSAERS